jgi:hypothetical protein
MTDLSIPTRRHDRAWWAGAAALAVLALTSVHHAYGAVVFDTPWRLHVLILVLPIAIAIVLALQLGRTGRNPSTAGLAMRVAAALILVVPVAAIGLYEGGYNHAVKVLVYVLFGEAAARDHFPPPLYEMPSDVFFEVTGVAQFALALAAGVLAVRLWQDPGR